MQWRSLCLLLLHFTYSLAESSIKTRANLAAFQFFSRTGHHILDEEIPKIEIPPVTIPIEGGPGTGEVSAENLKIIKFESPKFDFILSKEGLSWKSREGALKISGDWQAEYTILIPLYESGWVKAFVSDIRVSLTAGVYPLDGKPQVKIGDCTADISHLSIEIGGGVLPWLVNLFRSAISEAIRTQIHKQACTSARTILLQEANEFLHSLPSHIPIGADFYVDYSLDEKPTITSEYVEANLSADVVYGNVSCIPKRTGIWTDPGENPGMVTVWLSESIPNCLLSSAHDGGLVQFTVTKDIPAIKNYLQTSCSFISICIGRFFSKLKKEYPNQFVDLHFHTYQAPKLILEEGDGLVNATFAVDLQINPRAQHPEVLARLVLTSSSQVVPTIKGNRMVAVLNNTIVNVKEEFSKIGDVSQMFLSAFDKIFTMSVHVIVEAVLNKGVPLPIVDNVTIANSSRIDIFDQYVRLNIDFEYE